MLKRNSAAPGRFRCSWPPVPLEAFAWLQLTLAFGRLQNFFWRLTDGEGVSRSYEGNDRTSVPNFVSEERGSIVEIYMDDLPICVGAPDPGPQCSLPALAAACVILIEEPSRFLPYPPVAESAFALRRRQRMSQNDGAQEGATLWPKSAAI